MPTFINEALYLATIKIKQAMTLTVATSLALLSRLVWQRASVIRLCLPTIRYILLMFSLELPMLNNKNALRALYLCIKIFRTSFQIMEGTDNFGLDNQGSTGACILRCFLAKYNML